MTDIGITTTIPTEVLLAAGYMPADLNNLFISDPDPQRYVNIAERDGFPANCCTWIKGIYGVVLDKDIDTVICVTSGDCTNTVMLMEVLKLKGVNTIPFAYPDTPDKEAMQRSLETLSTVMGTTVDEAEEARQKLERARTMAHELDGLTWNEGVVSGRENHLWLVQASDFLGDVDEYERRLGSLMNDCRQRKSYPGDTLRLAYIGVPPIFARDLYDFIESHGARVVFNETQRQFAMPQRSGSLAEQYTAYTYPYSLSDRLNDILSQLQARRIDGVIHYVQSFCHRGIGDIVFRHHIRLPLLTLEGNKDYALTEQSKTRIETFLDMLKTRRSRDPVSSTTRKND
jgi:benzoyl-CoA reductase/2-hydroxyglutaryl-CoA dehydratase subunit BcrC/BadD/HgdB